MALYVGGNSIHKLDGSTWSVVSPDLSPQTVLQICRHNNELYAVSGDYTDSYVYKYSGSGTSWTTIGNFVAGEFEHNNLYTIFSLGGYLYAGGYRYAGTYNEDGVYGAVLYKYISGTTWNLVTLEETWSGFLSSFVSGTVAYLGDADSDIFGVFDGTTFTETWAPGGSCVYDYCVFNNKLYASCYAGKLYRPLEFAEVTPVDVNYDVLTSLSVFGDYLFIGSSGGKLNRMNSVEEFTLIHDFDGPSIPCLTVYNGELYIGTGNDVRFFAGGGDGTGLYSISDVDGTPASVYTGLTNIQCMFVDDHVATVAASYIGDTYAVLNGLYPGLELAQLWFHDGTGEMHFVALAANTYFAHGLSGLTPSTNYTFRAIGRDAVTREYIYGEWLSFTTLATPAVPNRSYTSRVLDYRGRPIFLAKCEAKDSVYADTVYETQYTDNGLASFTALPGNRPVDIHRTWGCAGLHKSIEQNVWTASGGDIDDAVALSHVQNTDDYNEGVKVLAVAPSAPAVAAWYYDSATGKIMING